MNFLKKTSVFLITLIGCFMAQPHVNATEFNARVDLAPAYAHIDVLESGKTVKTMDILAIRGEATWRIYKALCLKPMLLYGWGHDKLISGGLGVGFLIPIRECFVFTPSVGCILTELTTTIELPHFQLTDLKERFRSVSPYVGLEVCYRIGSSWRISASMQYAWSRTHTRIKKNHIINITDKSKTQGPTYSMQIERDINECWSVNLAGTYNISLTKEKHGLRASGVKLGLVRWF